MKDQDFGPTIGAGARRDPTLSIRPHFEPRQPRVRREIPTGWVSQAAFALLCITAAGGVLVLLGILLHIVWAAIMMGWAIL